MRTLGPMRGGMMTQRVSLPIKRKGVRTGEETSLTWEAAVRSGAT